MGSAAENRHSHALASRPPLCFVSHAWANGGHAFAVELCGALQQRSIDTWLDDKEVPIGASVRHSYREGILRKCDTFLALVTPEWHASAACQEELLLALDRRNSEALQVLPVHRDQATKPIAALGDARYIVLTDTANAPSIDRLGEAIRRGTIVSRLASSLREDPPMDRRESAQLLGQVAEPSSTPCLDRSLSEDPDPLTRYWSAIALGKIGTSAACDALRRAEETEKDVFVLEAITISLARGCQAGDTR